MANIVAKYWNSAYYFSSINVLIVFFYYFQVNMSSHIFTVPHTFIILHM